MKTALPLPMKEELHRLFSYNPSNGLLTRRTNTRGGKGKIGDNVGSPNRYGHLRVRVGNFSYAVHRLIWLMETGIDPGDLIVDHINLKPADNRWCNLRLVDHSVNSLNSDRPNRSKVYPGVHQRKGKWLARIGINYTRKHLGYFNTKEEAITARKKAERDLADARNDSVLRERSK